MRLLLWTAESDPSVKLYRKGRTWFIYGISILLGIEQLVEGVLVPLPVLVYLLQLRLSPNDLFQPAELIVF